MFSILLLSLSPFSSTLTLFVSRVARYTPSSQRQADEKTETNLAAIKIEHLLRNFAQSYAKNGKNSLLPVTILPKRGKKALHG